MAGISTVAIARMAPITDLAVLATLNSPGVEAALISLSGIITGAAITYSGYDTGALDESMEYDIRLNQKGIKTAFMGSGARSGHTVAQAAFNWYDHYDIDLDGALTGLPVDPDYVWIPHDDTRPGPTRPYEAACEELGIHLDINPEFELWATVGYNGN